MAAPKILTEADYLAADHLSLSNLDFVDGWIFDARSMAGGAYNHSLVASNLLRLLGNGLVGKHCRAHGGDLRVAMAKGNYVYPDALVECGKPDFRDEGPSDTLLNPIAVYEVLSPSTEGYDRGAKLDAYIATESILEIVILRPDAARVERYVRIDDGWRWEATVGLGASLRTLDLEIPLHEIYAGVELSPEAGPLLRNGESGR